jgi:hypothetical protein
MIAIGEPPLRQASLLFQQAPVQKDQARALLMPAAMGVAIMLA